MPEEIQIYGRIKELLDANMATLTSQIELNRELISVKLESVKKDTEELKSHAKETNGQVKRNATDILIHGERLEQEARRRKRAWAVSLAAVGAMFAGVTTYIIHKISGLQ